MILYMIGGLYMNGDADVYRQYPSGTIYKSKGDNLYQIIVLVIQMQ